MCSSVVPAELQKKTKNKDRLVWCCPRVLVAAWTLDSEFVHTEASVDKRLHCAAGLGERVQFFSCMVVGVCSWGKEGCVKYSQKILSTRCGGRIDL